MADTVEEVLLETESEMDDAVEALKRDMGRIRTGRAHPGMLDHVQVDYFGAPTPIRSLAQVSVQEGRTLLVQPYDKSSLKAIEQGIVATSGLSVPVQSDGNVLRLSLPELTTESRSQLVKEMRKRGEEGKIHVRNARRDGNDAVKKLEKDKKITEDDSKKGHEDVQELTDRFVDQIDSMMEAKEKDIMEL